MKAKLTAGTRGSKLALAQTNLIISKLKELYPSLEIDIKIIKTTGDKILDRQLSKIGGKGLFIKEIEEALEAAEVDFAVHSLKDVPHTLQDNFKIAAITKREDPRDVLICKGQYNINTLLAGSKVGTGSLRRSIQVKQIRKGLNILPIRGNIHTRINKMQHDYDAIILAAAGLKRVGWNGGNDCEFLKEVFEKNVNSDFNISYFDLENFIPAVGQGALAIETRKKDFETINYIKQLNHESDALGLLAERAFLKEIDGGCEIPVGAYCFISENKLTIDGFIGDEKEELLFREKLTGNINDYESLGKDLAKIVLEKMNKSKGLN